MNEARVNEERTVGEELEAIEEKSKKNASTEAGSEGVFKWSLTRRQQWQDDWN